MKWPLVRKWLSEKHPQIFQYLFAAVKSTSGKGLAIFFVVQPLELVAKTRKAQTAVSALLQKLLCLFNADQLGADPSAIGLKRDFCNWKNPDKLLYSNVLALRAIQSHRTPVVKELLRYLKPFGFAEYVKKSQREGLLYPDLRAERKLAKLYLHLYNAWIDSKDHCDLSVREIREMTGLSRPFVEKLLKAPPKWLRTQYISREEGWSLRIELETKLTQRSHHICTSIVGFESNLKKAIEVQDGERNYSLTKATLLLKHHGINQETALHLIKNYASQIPDAEKSTNCKNASKIVTSIYASYTHLLGIQPGCAPLWLVCNESTGTDELDKSSSDAKHTKEKTCTSGQKFFPLKKPMQTTLEKGGYPPVPIRRKVSQDQCIVFSGNFYSVPSDYVTQTVLACVWQNKLRIYNAINLRHIHTHDLANHHKGHYQFDARHFDENDCRRRKYLNTLLQSFRKDGNHIFHTAEKLVARHGFFAIRKLWLLRRQVGNH